MRETRISKLASTIRENVAKLEQYLEDNHLPSPSFGVDAPSNLGIPTTATEADKAKRAALEASLELNDLLAGPSALLRPNFNPTSLQFIYRCRLPFKVPLHETISFAKLAEQCELPELDVRRMLRFAMVMHRVFREPQEGMVAHTAASRLLLEDEREWDMAGLTWDEDWLAFSRTMDAVQQWGDSEPNHTGHSLAFDSMDNFFEWLKKHPAESKRFNSAISLFAAPGPSLSHLASVFPWSSLPKGTTIVDVGGGEGSVSIFLAEKFEELHFVVQDLPDVVAGQASKLPNPIRDRVNFMEHDFFTEQTTTGDVYILRAVLHNWPDHYCLRILQQLRPVLREGTKIVIQDGIVSGYGSFDLMAERNVRSLDMLMVSLFNAREREEGDWIRLIEEADARFHLIEVHRPPPGTMSVLVVEWLGGEDGTSAETEW